MPLSLATVGAKITAAFMNLIVAEVNKQGLTSVIPTSVAGTGVTLGAAGKVSCSASTSISVNGCFTSTYDNYQIIIDLTASGAAQILMVLRLSGTDAATAYDNQRLITSSTASTASQVLNTTSWLPGNVSLTGRTVGQIVLNGPALAAATLGTSNTLTTANPMTSSAGGTQLWIQHRTTTAYDGFTITPSTGNLTGSIRIYGFNNN